MFIRLNKKGQNTAEYAIVISLVVAAAIAMQVYLKRGWQGGVKFAVDKLKSDEAGAIGQYEPYYLESSNYVTAEEYKTTEETKTGGEIARSVASAGTPQETKRSNVQYIRGITGAD